MAQKEKKQGEEKNTAAVKGKESSYYEAVGRRKTAVARVRLFEQAGKDILINRKKLENYFPLASLRQAVEEPLKKVKALDKFKVLVNVKGGGISSQAGAIRHGIARALVKFNPEFKKKLKRAEMLTRDPRMKERRKFGLKKARKAPQWSKR